MYISKKLQTFMNNDFDGINKMWNSGNHDEDEDTTIMLMTCFCGLHAHRWYLVAIERRKLIIIWVVFIFDLDVKDIC